LLWGAIFTALLLLEVPIKKIGYRQEGIIPSLNQLTPPIWSLIHATMGHAMTVGEIDTYDGLDCEEF